MKFVPHSSLPAFDVLTSTLLLLGAQACTSGTIPGPTPGADSAVDGPAETGAKLIQSIDGALLEVDAVRKYVRL